MKRIGWMMLAVLPLMYAGDYSQKVAPLEMSLSPEVSVIELYDNVTLTMNGQTTPELTNNPAVNIHIKGGVMSLRAARGKAHRSSDRHVQWNVKNHFKHISEIRVFDRANLNAVHMKAPTILKHKSSGSVTIDGFIPLTLLEQKGSGSCALSFIDSKDADIMIHHGTANLSGVSKRLRYFAAKDAVVNAKALRVQVLWAHVKDDSVSFLMPIEQSHVVATDQAQIVLDNKTAYFSTLSAHAGQIVYNNLFALNP